MISIEELRIMNDTMIKYLNSLGIESKRNEVIRQILKDDDCFSKINKDDAYIILEDIGVNKREIPYVYESIVSEK